MVGLSTFLTFSKYFYAIPDLSFVPIIYIVLIESLIIYESIFKFARFIQSKVENSQLIAMLALACCFSIIILEFWQVFLTIMDEPFLLGVYSLVIFSIFILTLTSEGPDANIINPCLISAYLLQNVCKLVRI